MPVLRLKRIRGRPRILLYARVSVDDDGTSTSVPEQLEEGQGFAEDIDGDIVGEYADDGISASKYARQEREGWVKVEAEIAAGNSDILWLWEFSRGTRERKVWASLADTCQEHGMYIAIGEKVYDTTDPDDMHMLDQMMAAAVAESGRTKKRVDRAVESRARKGKPTGKAGYGYRHVYDPATGKLTDKIPDPEEAPVIAEIARRLLAGESKNTIAIDLNRRQVPNGEGRHAGQAKPDGKTSIGWSATTITQMMCRAAVMGRRQHHGAIIDEGGWTAIISEADWWAVQDVLDATGSGGIAPRDNRASHLLSGIATCGAVLEDGEVCAGRMFRHMTGRSSGRRQKAYVCKGRYPGASYGHTARRVDTLDDHVEYFLFTRFSDPAVLDAFDPPQAGAEREQALARLAELNIEQARLQAAIESGEVPLWAAAADAKRIDREITEAEERARPRRGNAFARELAGDPEAAWAAWTLEQKRKALRALTEAIRVLPLGRTGRRRVEPWESVQVTWRGAR